MSSSCVFPHNKATKSKSQSTSDVVWRVKNENGTVFVDSRALATHWNQEWNSVEIHTSHFPSPLPTHPSQVLIQRVSEQQGIHSVTRQFWLIPRWRITGFSTQLQLSRLRVHQLFWQPFYLTHGTGCQQKPSVLFTHALLSHHFPTLCLYSRCLGAKPRSLC